MAEIGCGKYHRIRSDGDFSSFEPENARVLYTQYYELTGSNEAKYILDNFDKFCRLCIESVMERQSDDDFAPYCGSGTVSTSRDPDSDEWKN